MSDQPSNHLAREQFRWLFYQNRLGTLDETTPPGELEELLSDASSVLEELLRWGLPLAVRLPDYAGRPEGAAALKVVFGKAKEGLAQFQATVRVCMAIGLQESKQTGLRRVLGSQSPEVYARPLSEEVFQSLPRVFELIRGYERLRHIANSYQRKSLIRALARGAKIDDGAWKPVPEGWPGDKTWTDLDRATRSLASKLKSDSDALLAMKLESQHELEQFAILGEKSAKASTKYLCPPIAAPGLDESVFEARSLLGWAYLNPFGPTECQVSLEFVPRRDAYLLVVWSAHPFTPSSAVLGVIPSRIARDKQGLLKVLDELFGRYRKHDLFLGHLPSYPIFFEGQSVLTSQEIGELILKRLARADVKDQVRTAVEKLLRFPCAPWARFQADWQEHGLRESLVLKTTFSYRIKIDRFLDKAVAEEEDEAVRNHPVQPARLGKVGANLSDRWALVSDPRHIGAYRRAMLLAWQLSQALASGT